MSKGDSMKKISITWDDLAVIPAEDFEAGRVAVTGLEGGDVTVLYSGLNNLTPYLTLAPNGAIMYKSVFNALGLGLAHETEEHPHGLIPTEPWAIIQLGDGRRAVRVDTDFAPWVIGVQSDGCHMWDTDSGVQALADKHGFEVLVSESRVEEAREEGRLAGIREVYEKYGPKRLADGAGTLAYYLEDEYGVEAFEEGDR